MRKSIKQTGIMFPETISREELQLLPPLQFTGEIILLDENYKGPDEVPELMNAGILGFDTETRPSFKKGRKNRVALLQLATDEKAFLVRLHRIGLPVFVEEILANPEIIKVGTAIRDDIRGLKRYTSFQPDGFVELQEYVKKFGIVSNSLRKIAGIVMKQRVSKSQQLSNWAAERLTEAQKNYAATDAWVCREIYRLLRKLEND